MLVQANAHAWKKISMQQADHNRSVCAEAIFDVKYIQKRPPQVTRLRSPTVRNNTRGKYFNEMCRCQRSKCPRLWADLLDVEAARPDVGGDEHAGMTAAELSHDGIALLLRHVPVHRAHREIVLPHLLRQPVHLEAVAEVIRKTHMYDLDCNFSTRNGQLKTWSSSQAPSEKLSSLHLKTRP